MFEVPSLSPIIITAIISSVVTTMVTNFFNSRKQVAIALANFEIYLFSKEFLSSPTEILYSKEYSDLRRFNILKKLEFEISWREFQAIVISCARERKDEVNEYKTYPVVGKDEDEVVIESEDNQWNLVNNPEKKKLINHLRNPRRPIFPTDYFSTHTSHSSKM